MMEPNKFLGNGWYAVFSTTYTHKAQPPRYIKPRLDKSQSAEKIQWGSVAPKIRKNSI